MLQMYLTTLSEYLNAYVGRRQQLVQVSQTHGARLAGEVAASRPFDYVQIDLALPNGSRARVVLIYDSVLSVLPTEAVLSRLSGFSLFPFFFFVLSSCRCRVYSSTEGRVSATQPAHYAALAAAFATQSPSDALSAIWDSL